MDISRRGILTDNSPLGPYPLEKLPKRDKITSIIEDDSLRPVESEHELNVARRGDYGPDTAKKASDSITCNPMTEALWASLRHISAFPENPVAEQKAPLPDDPHILSRHIKKYTYFLGAEQVGICKVPERVIYRDKPRGEGYKYAIVFLLRKDADTVTASHGDEWADDAASFVLYQRLAVIAVTLARYIRSLGYPAIASHTMNYTTLMPRLIVEAGLGEFSRMGIAVNPFIGASFKAACVLCDLPLEPDKPIDFGLQDYCESCRICADHCPVGAVPKGDKVSHNGYKTWVLDKKKCAMYCIHNPHGDICQRCTKLCPFNRPDGDPSQFRDWDGNLDYLYSLVNAQREHIISCGFEEPEEKSGKWWLPIRAETGTTIPVEQPDFDYAAHYARLSRMK